MDITKQKVDDFIETFNLEKEPVIALCLLQKNLIDVITIACNSVSESNKKNRHQNRINAIVLKEFGKKLNSSIVNELNGIGNFEELITLINKEKIKGIGLLAIYDISLRIGYYLKIYPDYIYLHAGTKIGAEILLGRETKERFIKKETLTKIHPALERLNCAELEVFFCVFHKKTTTKKNKIC
jgi:hypothetical protein